MFVSFDSYYMEIVSLLTTKKYITRKVLDLSLSSNCKNFDRHSPLFFSGLTRTLVSSEIRSNNNLSNGKYELLVVMSVQRGFLTQ